MGLIVQGDLDLDTIGSQGGPLDVLGGQLVALQIQRGQGGADLFEVCPGICQSGQDHVATGTAETIEI